MWAELYNRWTRLKNATIFLAGVVVGFAILAFLGANSSTITVSWMVWKRTLPVWEIAVAPLLAGLLLGYVYQLPARLHHFGEWMRHRHRVHELEAELREMRQSLDHVLQMPETDRPAKLAKVEHKALPEATESGDVDPFADEAAEAEDEHREDKHEDGHAAGPAKAKAAAPARTRRRLLGPLRDELKTIKVPQAKVVASARKPANGRRPRTRKPRATAAADSK